MAGKRRSYLRLGVSALAGALILETIVTVSVGFSKAFTSNELPGHLGALLVGSLGGWLFELFRELTATTGDAVETVASLKTSVEALTKRITYQDQALAMLLDCPRHNEALGALIEASMRDNFRNIPLVGVPRYLDFLRMALRHSQGYEGIQRRSLRWYRDNHAAAYLVDLRRRDMEYKKRLIILESPLIAEMEEDLKDAEVLNYYWSNTGGVQTYWVTASNFTQNFPSLALPADSALYDHQLFVAYNERTQVLDFNVLAPDDELRLLWRSLDSVIERGADWLEEVPRAPVDLKPAREISPTHTGSSV